jgi:hypothetical protein
VSINLRGEDFWSSGDLTYSLAKPGKSSKFGTRNQLKERNEEQTNGKQI